MRPLADLHAADLAPIHGLVFDLDDTVLTAGELTLEAYGALTVPPRFVSPSPYGAGFAEVARRLVDTHSGAGARP